MKKKILILLACIVAVISVLCTVFVKDEQVNNVLNNIQDKLIEEIRKEIIVSEETQQIAEETKECINCRSIRRLRTRRAKSNR